MQKTKRQIKVGRAKIDNKSYYQTLLANTGKNKIQSIKDLKKRFRNKFSQPTLLELNKIEVSPKIFQGRSVPYAKETVNKILREGYDITQEPIVVYQEGKRNIVISGHSRFEAAKRLFKAGDLSLRKIPVKYFIGDIDDAIDYAVIESNRSGKAEGIESDIKAYIRAKKRGYNKNMLLGIFKSGSYLNTLDALSHLNSKGEFIKYLINEDNITGNKSKKKEKSFPYLLRTAQWIGNLRKRYPELTNSHEQELFKFFYGGGPGLKLKYADFMDKVTAKIENPKWNPKKGLALTRESVFDIINDKDPLWIAYKSRLTAIKNRNEERLRLEEKYIENVLKKNKIKANALKKEIDILTQYIHEKIRETVEYINKLAKEDKVLNKTSIYNLFDKQK